MEGLNASCPYDIELLRRAELFSALLDEDLEFAASRSSAFQLKKGGRLFSVGMRADRFYIVLTGSIRVFRPREDGGSDEMAVFTVGDALGDFDFCRRASYDACAEAFEDSTLLTFPGIGLDMDGLARERPETVSRILLRSLAMIASRVRSTQRLITENAPWVQELRRSSFEDPGTGLWNRAFLDEELSRAPVVPTALVLLKPDRFKILVDGRGHAAGDEAMIRIAAVLKSQVRHFGRGWALRLKSNEVALVLPRCGVDAAAVAAMETVAAIAALDPVPAEAGLPPFSFSASAAYGLWPEDQEDWSSLMEAVYGALLETWRAGGNRTVRYRPASGRNGGAA